MAQPISTKPEGGDPVTPGMARLKFRLQLVAVSDAGQEQIHEVGQFEHEGVAMENPGPHLGRRQRDSQEHPGTGSAGTNSK